jgi:hypothetical protein
MTIKKLSAAFLFSALLLNSCTEKANPTPPPPPPAEENIAFSIEPDPGSTIVSSSTATYPYTVKVTSNIKPSNGIHVDYATQLDTDNSNPTFTRESSTTATSYSLTTSNLESGKLYKVTVKVTSQKTSTNTLTKTFKVARK